MAQPPNLVGGEDRPEKVRSNPFLSISRPGVGEELKGGRKKREKRKL